MTDQTDNTETQTEEKTEKQLLMDRARLLGISFSNNITVDKLKAKIAEKLGEEPDGEGDEDETVDENNDGHDDRDGTFVEGNTVAADDDEQAEEIENDPVEEPEPTPAPAPTPTIPERLQHLANPTPAPTKPKASLTAAQRKALERQEMHDEMMALVRVRITNMDPKKKDLPGEIFTVANEVLGTVKKFVPYGEQTDNGYHIPRWIYLQLEDRKFQHIRTVKDPRTGTMRPETRWLKEFALEILPPLTQEELDRLATAQMAAGSVDDFA